MDELLTLAAVLVGLTLTAWWATGTQAGEEWARKVGERIQRRRRG